jgi:hypothetical protein
MTQHLEPPWQGQLYVRSLRGLSMLCKPPLRVASAQAQGEPVHRHRVCLYEEVVAIDGGMAICLDAMANLLLEHLSRSNFVTGPCDVGDGQELYGLPLTVRHEPLSSAAARWLRYPRLIFEGVMLCSSSTRVQGTTDGLEHDAPTETEDDTISRVAAKSSRYVPHGRSCALPPAAHRHNLRKR